MKRKIKSDRQFMGETQEIHRAISDIQLQLQQITDSIEAVTDYFPGIKDRPKTKYINNDQLHNELIEYVRSFNTQSEAATALGIPQSNINAMMHFKKPISKDVAFALGYRMVVAYEKL